MWDGMNMRVIYLQVVARSIYYEPFCIGIGIGIECECAHFAILIKLSLIIIDANAFYATSDRAFAWPCLTPYVQHLDEWTREKSTFHYTHQRAHWSVLWARVCLGLARLINTNQQPDTNRLSLKEKKNKTKTKKIQVLIFTLYLWLFKNRDSQVRGLECARANSRNVQKTHVRDILNRDQSIVAVASLHSTRLAIVICIH